MNPARLIVLALAVVASLLAGRADAASATQLPVGAAPLRYDVTLSPDARRLTFEGRVRIALSLSRPMDEVTLNAADLTIAHAELDGAPATTALDAATQTARFKTGRILARGSHVLSIAYAGRIGQAPAGLFVVDYQGRGGKPERMLATQFEPSDARRVLPCFDEPAYKAVFALTALIPAGQLALSNMPEASHAQLAGGLARVSFQPTPRMSSYLLFFGAGDLERTSRRVDGVEVGVVTPRGEAARARYALDAAAAILPFYDAYFGVRYPLPKLDLVAAPGEVGGAMENWGAILFSQRYAAVDPRLTTVSERHEVFDTVAHEMAHQWFGDLVTMQWWDDLWLNEGFATWMATKATSRFHPEWRPRLMALADKDSAMTQDARPGAHAIVQPVETVAQAEQAFDDITYLKGAAVIAMLENDVGPDVFRAGVRRYIAQHSFANARTEALWTALDRAAGRPVSAVAHDFTDQPGVPVVRVSQSAGLSGLSRLDLTPGRFQEGGAQPLSGRWRIPVRHRAVGARQAPETLTLAGPTRLPGGDAEPVVVNAGQAGYYRAAYAPALFASLLRRVGQLSPADQIGLMHDQAALGRTGEAPLSSVLALIAALPADAESTVQRQAVDVLLAVGDLYPDGSRSLPAYKAWARRVIAPWWARVAFDPRPDEPAAAALLRERLITGLSRFGDEAVIAEANRRFDLFRTDPGTLPTPIRRAVLRTVARHADARRFDQLHVIAQSAPGALEKEHLYSALATVEDEKLAGRVLDLAVGPEPPAHVGPGLIRTVAAQQPDLAWAFTLAHETQIQTQLDALQRTTFVPDIADESSDPARAVALEAYAADKLPADARKPAERAAASIRWRAEIRAKRVPEVVAWIAAQGGSAASASGRPTR